jgi:hypothetical protein
VILSIRRVLREDTGRFPGAGISFFCFGSGFFEELPGDCNPIVFLPVLFE